MICSRATTSTSLVAVALVLVGCASADSARYAPAPAAGGMPNEAPPPPPAPINAGGGLPGADAALGGDVYFDELEIDGELARPDGDRLAVTDTPTRGRAADGNDKNKELAPAADPKGSGKMAKEGEGAAPNTPAPPAERLIIYTATLTIHVFEVEKVLETLTDHSKKLGGWIQQSTSNSLIIRVPVANFEGLLEAIEGEGDVVNKNVVGQDVTEEFFDLQIRLKNAMVLRQRYVELLAKAKNVAESLQIERELGRITGQIEQLKGRLKFLRAYAQNSTITVYVQKKPDVPVEVRRVPLPFHWLQQYRLDNAFY